MPATCAQTTKSEFTRYLDAHEDEVPALRALAKEYRRDNPHRHTFGMWLHARHLAPFQAAYTDWWLKRPQRFGSVYEETDAPKRHVILV